jgi:hypothetical protein
MPIPSGWSAPDAVSGCRIFPWRGYAWRAHRAAHPATEASAFTGRYNRGFDQVPAEQAWPALYLGRSQDICLAEMSRHLPTDESISAAEFRQRLHRIRDLRLSKLLLKLKAVLDCRDPSRLGLKLDDLIDDLDRGVTQAIGAAALARGVEGLLVPSATRLGNDLVVFCSQLRAGSEITVVETIEPRLYVMRR